MSVEQYNHSGDQPWKNVMKLGKYSPYKPAFHLTYIQMEMFALVHKNTFGGFPFCVVLPNWLLKVICVSSVGERIVKM